MPIVRQETFDEFIETFSLPGLYAVDTETTGLRSYLGDALFSVIVAGPAGSFYLNFKSYPGLSPEWVLDRDTNLPRLKQIFSNPDSTWFAHNAKFDLAMLAKEGLAIQGRIHCTEAQARLLYNRHFDYTLSACAKRIGLEKSNAVDEYISKNKLYTKFKDETTGKEVKQPHFDQVPFNIITEYGMTDGEITLKLGLHQLSDLQSIVGTTPSTKPPLTAVYNNETKLTKTCFKMEYHGIKIDRDYSRRAFEYEIGRARTAAAKFTAASGVEFVDSAITLAKAFDTAGETYPRTKPTKTRPHGTPSFTDVVLESFTSPLAQLVREYRDASKKANTYYANFLKYADTGDRIHANMRQGGTDTGRFSYSEPNLQNLSKEEDTAQQFLIRRSFVPTDPDHCFVMIDYDQMEYRLMLDYAGEMGIIRQILDDGLDVHQATALQLNVPRESAKTLNFLLLYGGGVKSLAIKLKTEVDAARVLREQYFRKLPNVQYWSSKVVTQVEKEKNLVNWLGRQYHFPYINDDVEYRAYAGPNHLIQGGCADIVRVAMNRCDDLLSGTRSRLLVQIHDELLFEVHKDDLGIVSALKRVMETAYPHRYLPLTCGVSYSWRSWADKTKGLPT